MTFVRLRGFHDRKLGDLRADLEDFAGHILAGASGGLPILAMPAAKYSNQLVIMNFIRDR